MCRGATSKVVVNVETESDIEVLRNATRLLAEQNELLTSRIERLVAEIKRLKGANQDTAALEREVSSLKEQVQAQRDALFGDSSEKSSTSSDEQRAGKPSTDEKKKKKGHGPTSQPRLQRETRDHKLDDSDRQCPKCGGRLEVMVGQFEESEEIDAVATRYVVVHHRRQKYRCRCNSHVETALGPTKLAAGSRYSILFAVLVAISKYADHMPLERQVRMMRRFGLRVTSQTLWDMLETLARLLEPLPERIHKYLLSQTVLGADETHWKLLKKGSKTTTPRWYVWTVCCASAVLYRIYDTRAHTAAAELLKGFSGKLVSDGYSVYPKLVKDGIINAINVFCWSHVRRAFFKATKFFPEAKHYVDLIDSLFRVDRQCPGPPGSPELLAARQKDSKPIIDELRKAAEQCTALPESSLGKAVAYMNDLWGGLTVFLEDPWVPLHNNGSEGALRDPVVGRKNHHGSKSKRGTEVAALFYTLIKTAERCGHDPRTYLTYAVLTTKHGQTPRLPHEMTVEELEATNEELKVVAGLREPKSQTAA